jgi:hypothetical protein
MKKEVLIDLQAQEGPVEHGRRKIREVEIDEEASFLCSKCSTNPNCMVCHENRLPHDPKEEANTNVDVSSITDPKSDTNGEAEAGPSGSQAAKKDIGGEASARPSGSQEVKDETEEEEKVEDEDHGPLRFRCFRCKQEAHYEHCKLLTA